MTAFERPLPWGKGHGRVWSLWDMLEFNARAFHQATTALATISAWVHAAKDQSQFTHKENTAPRCLEWVVTTHSSLPQVFLCSAERRFLVPA